MVMVTFGWADTDGAKWKCYSGLGPGGRGGWKYKDRCIWILEGMHLRVDRLYMGST